MADLVEIIGLARYLGFACVGLVLAFGYLAISIGEGGWAYGAGSQSEAAARSGGKVYRARMTYPMRPMTPDRKDAMVQLVTQMME